MISDNRLEMPSTSVSDRLILANTGQTRRFDGGSGVEVIDIRSIIGLENLQQTVFGSSTAHEVFRQIFIERKGVPYLALDPDNPNMTVGYAIVKTGELEEKEIQAELNERDKLINAGVSLYNLSYFHDHYDYAVPQDTVVLHEIGVLPSE